MALLDAFQGKQKELLACFEAISAKHSMARWNDESYEFHYLLADQSVLEPILGTWSSQIYFAFFMEVPSGTRTEPFDGYLGFSERFLRVHVPLKHAEHFKIEFSDGTVVDDQTAAYLFDESRRHRMINESLDSGDAAAAAVLLAVYVERSGDVPCAGKPTRFLPTDVDAAVSSHNRHEFERRLKTSPMPENLYAFRKRFLSNDLVSEILSLVSSVRETKGLRTSIPPLSSWQLLKYEYLHHPMLDAILYDLEALVASVFGVEKLFPHRAECRAYLAGSHLPFHYDDHPHDFSVTINLAPVGNLDPIYLFVPDKKDYKKTEIREFALQPGDALFFHGVSVRHGRPLFAEANNVQLLLHYSYRNVFNMESTYYREILFQKQTDS